MFCFWSYIKPPLRDKFKQLTNLTLSATPGLYLNSSPAKYSYLSISWDDNAEISAASLPILDWAWFALIFLIWFALIES